MPKSSAAKAAAADTNWSADALADGGLEALLGFHLRMANVALYRDFAATFAELDITQRQAATLSLIGANPGAPQVAIANHLGSDRATIMAMVERLEARGFIVRHRSEADRRRQELYLSPLGEATLQQCKALIAAHEARFTSRFSEAELAALKDALKRIYQAD